jgi:hypothetical protein
MQGIKDSAPLAWPPWQVPSDFVNRFAFHGPLTLLCH